MCFVGGCGGGVVVGFCCCCCCCCCCKYVCSCLYVCVACWCLSRAIHRVCPYTACVFRCALVCCGAAIAARLYLAGCVSFSSEEVEVAGGDMDTAALLLCPELMSGEEGRNGGQEAWELYNPVGYWTLPTLPTMPLHFSRLTFMRPIPPLRSPPNNFSRR